MENTRLNGELTKDQKIILTNLMLLWSMRPDLEIGQLLDNITCLDPKEDSLHDVTDEDFMERLNIQIEAYTQLKVRKYEKNKNTSS